MGVYGATGADGRLRRRNQAEVFSQTVRVREGVSIR